MFVSYNWSAEEMLGRWEDVRDIRNRMGRVSADYVLKKDGFIFSNHWSQREDVCLGVNEGYYVGRAAVAGYYAAQDKRIAVESAKIQQLFPQELGGKSAQEIHGVGMMDYKPVDTYVIEEAADGKTAKGIWMLRGSHSQLTQSGPVAYWEWGWFAVDFVREEEQWKIWHMQYLQEIDRVAGGKWTGPEKTFQPRPEFADFQLPPLPQPTVSVPLRQRYSPSRPFTPSPRLPEPYETFAETFSYGIEEEARYV